MSAPCPNGCAPGCFNACPRLIPLPSESGLNPDDYHCACWCECHVDDDGACVVHPNMRDCKPLLGKEVPQ
jgi:hypothetical protein